MYRYQLNLLQEHFVLDYSAFGPSLLFTCNRQINKKLCEGHQYPNVCGKQRKKRKWPKDVQFSSKHHTMLWCYLAVNYMMVFFSSHLVGQTVDYVGIEVRHILCITHNWAVLLQGFVDNSPGLKKKIDGKLTQKVSKRTPTHLQDWKRSVTKVTSNCQTKRKRGTFLSATVDTCMYVEEGIIKQKDSYLLIKWAYYVLVGFGQAKTNSLTCI